MEFLLAIALAVILLSGHGSSFGQETERDYSTERYSATSHRTWNTGDEK